MLGLISAALLCLVCIPPHGEHALGAGSFPKQRLVIEPALRKGMEKSKVQESKTKTEL